MIIILAKRASVLPFYFILFYGIWNSDERTFFLNKQSSFPAC